MFSNDVIWRNKSCSRTFYVNFHDSGSNISSYIFIVKTGQRLWGQLVINNNRLRNIFKHYLCNYKIIIEIFQTKILMLVFCPSWSCATICYTMRFISLCKIFTYLRVSVPWAPLSIVGVSGWTRCDGVDFPVHRVWNGRYVICK